MGIHSYIMDLHGNIVFNEIVKNYERLIKREQTKNDNLRKEIRSITTSFEAIKNVNRCLFLNLETLKNDNLFLRNHINVLSNETVERKTNKEVNHVDQANHVNEEYFIKNCCFIIYQIGDGTCYCVFIDKESLKNENQFVLNRKIILYDTDCNYGTKLFQIFREENKKELDFLKNAIITILESKIKNFDISLPDNKKMFLDIFNKNKGFEVIGNKITLNRSSIDDVILYYSIIKKKINEIYHMACNF